VRHHGAVDLAGERRTCEELATRGLDGELRLDVEALAGPEVLVARPLHPPVDGEVRLPDRREDRRLPRPAHLPALLDEGDEALVRSGRLLDGRAQRRSAFSRASRMRAWASVIGSFLQAPRME
jgi:hypothetical protein